MVKPLGGVPPKRPSFLRIDMKRKLPAPFTVSRGYTPEYPWLGQQHPEPKPAKKPLLLMQQSPAGIFKCLLCVACFIFGLALIAYAGSAILRGQAARSRLQQLRPVAPAPAAAALVQGVGEETYTDDIRDADQDNHGPASAHEPPAVKVTAVAGNTPPLEVAPAPLGLEGVDGPSHVADDAPAPADVHGPIVVRMVDEPPPEAAAAASQEELPAAVAEMVAEPAVGQKEIHVVSVSVDTEVGEAVGQEVVPVVQGEDQGGVETAKHLLLLMRLANVAEAQRELEKRVQVTDVLKAAYDELQEGQDAAVAGSEQGTAQEGMALDDPTLHDLLATENASQPREQLDEAADNELARQLLLWFLTHPETLEQEQAADGVDENLPAEDKVPEGVADGHPAQEQVYDGVKGVDNEPVQAGRQLDQLSHDEADPESVVSWTQLNEDDKQDALLPNLAARGLEGDNLPTNDSTTAGSRGGTELEPANQEDVEQTNIVPRTVLAQELEQEVDEGQTLQQYRDLLSRRVPLMHHVLQLRRSQQETLQQEQRATAYLRLLDLHLLQQQQEAAARQRRRQHLRDMQRLEAYAQQLQQQDQQLHAQQVWWEQQAPQTYAQQAQADQRLYNQQTYSGAAGVQHAHAQQVSAAQPCVCPHHRIARTTQMSYESSQSAW